MNPYLIAVLSILLLGYLLDLLLARLTLRSLSLEVPEEFADLLDAGEYRRTQDYTRARVRLSLIHDSLMLPLTVLCILLGGFRLLEEISTGFGLGSTLTGLIYIGLLALLGGLVQLPFSLWSTFVIEARFGLNRTTVRTFLLDTLKVLLLSVVIGGPLLALILYFFEHAGSHAWLWCWLLLVLFSLLMQFVAPVLIMPLFNRFTPLEEGELKEAITSYARGQGFALQGIFTMDGSRRSSRANAFFTGFGRFRRIVFFDTLVDKLKVDELLAILAHEMGHWKMRHIHRMMLASMLQAGLMFWILSQVITSDGLAAAFGLEQASVHTGLVFFGFLYSPVSLLLSIAGNGLSRKYEYQADAFAARTTGRADALISGLKKLCLVNLANLTPHPLLVVLQYSHPPVIERIRALRELE